MIPAILKIFALMHTFYIWLPGFLVLLVVALVSHLSTKDKLLFILLSALSPLLGVVLLVLWRKKMFGSGAKAHLSA